MRIISQPSFVLLSLVLGAASVCSAASITYDVNLTIAGFCTGGFCDIGAGSVTGDIVTDGTIGALQTANIIDWNLVLNNGDPVPGGDATFDLLGPLSGANSGATVGNNSSVQYDALSATATQLLFNFSDSDPEAGWLIFQSPNVGAGFPGSASGEDYAVCIGADYGADGPCGPSGGISLTMDYPVADQFTSLSGTQAIGTASSISSTPEPSALALLGGGMITLLGFRKTPSLHRTQQRQSR